MVHHFDNLVEAVAQISSEGYLLDFENLTLQEIDEFDIDNIETTFIEGNDSSPDTSTMIYLINMITGEKGYLISPHSIYKDERVEEIETLLTQKFTQDGNSN